MKKKTGRLAAGLLLLISCLLLSGNTKATADAGGQEIAADQIRVEYLKESITVTTAKDSVIYFTDNYSTDLEKWYFCEVRNGKAVFDISWLKSSATTKLYLCGDVQTKVTCREIEWQEKLGASFTGTLLSTDITESEKWIAVYQAYPNFSEDTGYLVFTVKEDNRDKAYFALSDIEWRKGDSGVFRSFSELDLREMNMKGITLQFRIRGKDEQVPGDGTGYRASSLAKVAIQKLGNAPTITLHEDSATINVKNGMEFSLDGVHWTLIPAYNKKAVTADYMVGQAEREQAIAAITTTTKVSKVLLHRLLGEKTSQPLTKAYITGKYTESQRIYDTADRTQATGIYLYVREAATVKKPASRIRKVFLPFSGQNDVAWADDILLSPVPSKTGTGGVQVENRLSERIQVAIVTPEDQKTITDWNDLDVSELKWTSIKAKKSLKLAYSKVPKGSYLLYRIAAEEGELPSTYVRSAQINHDSVTYADISTDGAEPAVGTKLTAVISTNVSITDVICHWQRCADIKAAQPIWEEITTGATYTLTEADAGKYIRIYFEETTGGLGSDPVGPVK